MNEMTVTVFEQPGALGKIKAQALSQLLQQFYLSAPQEIRDEIDRRAEELRNRKEAVSCRSGTISQDTP